MDRHIFLNLAEYVKKNPSMEEDEMTLCYDRAGFFSALGYKQFGVDIRSQKILKSEKKPDRFCRDDVGNTIFVFESKRPDDEEFEKVSNPTKIKWFSQLWNQYVIPTRAKYGILTNGKRFILYERVGLNPLTRLDLHKIEEITQVQSDLIESLLKKPDRAFTSVAEIDEYVKSDYYNGLKIDEALDEFYDTMKFIPTSSFGKLLSAVYRLFISEYKEKSRNFTTVAFDFWRKSYATRPMKVPEAWKAFYDSKENKLLQFMFCLETTHTLIARLILAKVCEDYSFPGISGIKGIRDLVQHYRESIPRVSYPLFVSRLLLEMKESLVESIFEEDIYSWWTDTIRQLQLKTPKEIAEFPASAVLDDFSATLSRIIFAVARFDFSSSQQDLLGNLYQTYFDKETRKALGEFYTKEEIVSYILDEINYKEGVSNKRLLDPCCGSGTFVVCAVRRYLSDATSRIPAGPLKYSSILRDLCLKPRIVALDIHPFAVIMTQIRLMVELIPFYIKAIKEEAQFLIHRLPVFRTDSLEQETKSEARTLLSFGKNTIEITIELPIRLNKDQFHSIIVSIPDKQLMFKKGKINNIAEYFGAVQAVFDAVKYLAKLESYSINENVLERNLANYLKRTSFSDLTNLLMPSCEGILSTVKSLKYQFGDGRLVKSIEDIILASILKNYVSYDFIVANPPYIRAARGTNELRNKYRKLYTTPWGSFDTYAVFIEQFIRLLNESGKLGIITSNKYLVMDYAIHLRPFLSNNCLISQLIDLTGCPDAFEEPLVNACILIATRCSKEIDDSKGYNKITKKKLLVGLVKQNSLLILSKISKDFRKKHETDDNSLETYWTKQNELPHGQNGTWELFVTPEINTILQKIAAGSVLIGSDLVGEVRGGVRGTEYAVVETCVHENKTFEAEKSVKLLNVGSIAQFCSRWGQPVRYRWKTYYRPYLEYHPDKFSNALWTTFESKKILIRGVAKRLTAYYDEEGVGFLRAIWAWLPKNVKPDFAVGLLNSQLYDFIHKARMRSARIPEGSYSYPLSFIESLPIRLPKTSEQRKLALEIKNLAVKLKNDALTRLKISLFPEAYLELSIETDDEVFTSDRDYPSKNISLTKNLSGYILIQAGSKVIHSTSKLATELNKNYFNLALNNVKFRKDQEIRIKFPHNDHETLKILKAVNRDIAKVVLYQRESLQSRLNDLVFAYYGINSAEKVVVSKFIEKMQIHETGLDEEYE